MPRALIVGASRGIGLELVRQLSAANWTLHATCRDLGRPGPLAEIGQNVNLHELEVRDAEHIARLVTDLREQTIDVMIHNAGVHDREHDPDTVMEINAKAPFKVVEPLLPNLQRATNPRLILVSSQLGARHGGNRRLGVYGESKARLNDRFRELANAWGELGINAIVLHPGWVQTDMGGASATLSVEQSASGICNLVEQMGPEHHGGFWTWDGREHPW